MEDREIARNYEKILNDKESARVGIEAKKQTYEVLIENIMKEDFNGTRRAAYMMIFLPMAINVYFIYTNRGKYMRNMLSIGSLLGGYFYMNFRFRNEVDMFIKKDDISQNMARDRINVMHAVNYSAPEYIDETEEILGKFNNIFNTFRGEEEKFQKLIIKKILVKIKKNISLLIFNNNIP